MANPLIAPLPKLDLFQGSLGEFLHSKIQSHPQDLIIQVNGVTGESQTIGEVLKQAVAVAGGLQARGVLPGDVIIIMGNYSPHYFATTLGIILTNALIFPINPAYKEVELEHLLRVAPPKIVFAENQALVYITAALKKLNNGAEVILLDHVVPVAEPDEQRLVDLVLVEVADWKVKGVGDPKNDPAVIMHSSGTTGVPKAVQMTHTNFIYNVQTWEEVPEVRNQTINLQATLGSWLTGFTITIQSWLYGFCRVYTNPVTPLNLLQAIQKGKPHWMITSPFGLYNMVAHQDFLKFDVSSLKKVLIGGAAPPKQLTKLVQEKWPGLWLEQIYGSTEMSNYSEPFTRAPLLYAGRLFRGLEVKIVDVDTQKVLKPNEYGELRFRSKYPLLQRYVGNEAATAAAMDEEGFFRTEDIGTITEEGFIHLTGRIKDYIETRNGRVTPVLLEGWILELEGAEEAMVVGVPQEDATCLVAAAVVIDPHSKLTKQRITQHIAENYSLKHKLNGGVHLVESLPRNANGKLLKDKARHMIGL